MKLGSLFDGSGGFPLAGVINGIEPVWASEIEPFPIRVTKLRFPNMKHLGSVTDINGAEIEPVDIITFGSPCQDLSVAGKQAGIHDGERSSLFFEAVRIIKEMREHDRAIGRADHDVRPRFAVWENVPGAFSSNHGADFQAVLQAFCDIMEDGLHIPRPKKWNHAGCVAGNGWSLAWRVYDAQYWPGTPQRRKRIYLVADFASERAGEILFERESVCGDPAQGGEAGEGTAEDAEGSVGGSGGSWCFKERAGKPGGGKGFLPGHERAFTLATNVDQSVCYALDSLSSNSMKSANPHSGFHEEQVTKTLQTNPDPTCNQGGNVIVQTAECYALEGNTVDRASGQTGKGYCVDVSPTLNTQDKHAVTYAIVGNGQRKSHQGDGYSETDKMYTLNATDRHAVAYGLSRSFYCGGANGGGIPIGENYQPGMTANGCGAVCCLNDQGGAVMDVSDKTMTLRAQEHGHQPVVCYGLEPCAAQRQNVENRFSENVSPTLRANCGDNRAAVVYSVENHPADSRVNIIDDGKCQTLTSRMGTGGGQRADDPDGGTR